MVALSGALMPGPLLVYAMTRAAQDGFWTGPALMLGHAIAEIATVALLLKGAGELLKRPRIFGVIAILGAGFLIWMGFGSFSTSGEQFSLSGPATGDAGTSMPDPVSGIVLSLANPYWILWWATVGSTYLAWASKRGHAGVGLFFTGHIAADAAWYSLTAFLVATGSQFLTPAVYGIIMKVLSVVLWGMGGYFLLSGAKALWKARED